ncbi:MAG: hypothetical protein ACOCYU_04785 [Brevefilum sp.]
MNTKSLKTNDVFRQSSSYRRHQKQRFWQIFAPIILGGLITLAAAVLMVLALTGSVAGINLSQIADTSLIWLILPVMMFGILFAFLILGMVYLVARVLNILPKYTFLVQQYATLIESRIKLWTKKALEPIITAKSISAAGGAFFRNLSGRKKK